MTPTTTGTVSVCSTPSSVVTVVKLGAEEVTLFWMHCLCCSSPLPTYLAQVQVEQALVLPVGFFRSAGGEGRRPEAAGRPPGGGASTQFLFKPVA